MGFEMFLKVTVFVSSCSDGGKLFQAAGPAKLKLRSPSL